MKSHRRLAAAYPELSAKALPATGQHIPGLGNGTLKDILFRADIHPKAKVSMLSHQTLRDLHKQIRDTLLEMTALGGRDTEKDLYGLPGLYHPDEQGDTGRTLPDLLRARAARKLSGRKCVLLPALPSAVAVALLGW